MLLGAEAITPKQIIFLIKGRLEHPANFTKNARSIPIMSPWGVGANSMKKLLLASLTSVFNC
jgi:hypothetical protein